MPLAKERAIVVLAIEHNIPIPQLYKEAVNYPIYSKQQKGAINFKISQLFINRIWEELVLLRGMNLVTSKQVFILKFFANSSLKRFKARLVARGFSQQYGINYTKTVILIIYIVILRVFFTTVAYKDLKYRQYNIKNAFTKSELKEEIWIKLLYGLQRIKERIVLYLLRSLYGLKQAARDWNLLIRSELEKQGFY